MSFVLDCYLGIALGLIWVFIWVFIQAGPSRLAILYNYLIFLFFLLFFFFIFICIVNEMSSSFLFASIIIDINSFLYKIQGFLSYFEDPG